MTKPNQKVSTTTNEKLTLLSKQRRDDF